MRVRGEYMLSEVVTQFTISKYGFMRARRSKAAACARECQRAHGAQRPSAAPSCFDDIVSGAAADVQLRRPFAHCPSRAQMRCVA